MEIINKFINSFYNDQVEDYCVRLLYFFNTIDTYFWIAGSSSFLVYTIVSGTSVHPLPLIPIITAVWLGFRLADFYPLFLLFGFTALIFLFQLPGIDFSSGLRLLGLNLLAFFIIQFFLMGIPDSIVARDPFVSIGKMWKSLFTIAPTTVSLSMSVFFSTFFSFVLIAQPLPWEISGLAFWSTFFGGAVVTRFFLPKAFQSETYLPNHKRTDIHRVIVLNIDGCRHDRLKEVELPSLNKAAREGTHFPKGMQTVYRALTNPAFASILTGTIPKVHGIKDNNLGQAIKVDGLPDLVSTKLYGSMHVKHFSKPEWDTAIVSLPLLGVGKSDDYMFDMMKEDLLKDDPPRLLIADVSELDFLGHAYGSESDRYIMALQRAGRLIEDFIDWCSNMAWYDDTVFIICSDHGMKMIDHSYLIFNAEKFVPFYIFGKGVQKNQTLNFDVSILDIAPTICFALNIPYPAEAKGRVIIEAFDQKHSTT